MAGIKRKASERDGDDINDGDFDTILENRRELNDIHAYDINFKLCTILPKLLLPHQLNDPDQFFSAIKNHVNGVLPSVDVAQQIHELDLSLPSSYAQLFDSDNKFLYDILVAVIKKFKFSKFLRLPDLKINELHKLLTKLKYEQILTLAKYDCINITLTKGNSSDLPVPTTCILDSLLACNPKEFCFYSTESPFDSKGIKGFLSCEIPSVVDRPTVTVNGRVYISWNKELKDAGLPILQKDSKQQKSKPLKKKIQIPPALIQDQYFTYDDSFNISPAQPIELFTPFDYWNLSDIHEKGYNGRGIKVALVDTGIDKHHPAFKLENITTIGLVGDTMIYDTVGHGTLCAGILCGQSFQYSYDPKNSSEKKSFPCGVAPDVNLIVCKVTSSTKTFASTANVVQILQWINEQTDIDIVCFTIGSSTFSLEVSNEVNALINKGVVVVCAAGYHGSKFVQMPGYPAQLGTTLCIGSHGRTGNRSVFSPGGQELDFLGPGEKIIGPSNTLLLHDVAVASGTSYATAAVTGLICLILQYINEQAVSIDTLKYMKNQWIIKELLRKMSSNPLKHSHGKGYGCLNPIMFFQRPHDLFQSVVNEMYKPSPLET